MTPWSNKHLPDSLWAAMARGARGLCPRCGAKHLFPRYLKPTPLCPGCGQDWTLHQADDFPPYVSIIITGHVMAPVMIEIGSSAMPLWAMIALSVVIASVLMIGLLQPAKGGIIALQWWNGMHGFKPAGRDEVAAQAVDAAPN